MYKELKNNQVKNFIFTLLLILAVNLGFGQGLLLQSTSNSTIVLTGTSSLHDWSMKSAADQCKLQLNEWPKGNSFIINEIKFELSVKQLKSEHNKMDANAQKALKSDKYPLIRFSSNSPQNVTSTDTGKMSRVKGLLEIAGVSKEVELNVSVKNEGNAFLHFHFTFDINMEEFSVKPPSFMFGAVTTGSFVKAEFELQFNK